jgi:hypothetical protein
MSNHFHLIAERRAIAYELKWRRLQGIELKNWPKDHPVKVAVPARLQGETAAVSAEKVWREVTIIKN